MYASWQVVEKCHSRPNLQRNDPTKAPPTSSSCVSDDGHANDRDYLHVRRVNVNVRDHRQPEDLLSCRRDDELLDHDDELPDLGDDAQLNRSLELVEPCEKFRR